MQAKDEMREKRAMKNFIILFEEKEGTSPLVQLLSNVDQISIVHQIDNSAWEPFDRHCCGPMSLRSLGQCLEMIYDQGPVDIDSLNRIYTKTAKKPLEVINKSGSIGFKMRFRPARKIDRATHKLLSYDVFPLNLLGQYEPFKRVMIDLLRRNNVVVFLTVRQDVLRWALSKYHGDGTGKRGHLQFKLASGEIRREDIAKVHVNCDRLEEVILRCEKSHANKRKIMTEFRETGIEVYPLRYEDFLEDKSVYLERVCELLGVTVSPEEVTAALKRGSGFEKVHSDQISDFVENHREVMARFGSRFVAW